MKITAGALASVLVLGAGAVLAGLHMADGRMQRKVEVKVQPVAWRSDAQALERGRYL
ncbi:MAG: cytochrome c, partial [Comamonadaceae bacterium]